MMSQVLLSAEAVSKSFPGQADQGLVLDSIDVDIFAGDFTVIMGSSGAGKSTFLYALSGMDDITDGRVSYQGQALGGLSEKQMAHLRAEEFGFVFQQTHLVSNLTLLENVLVAGYVGGGKPSGQVRERAEGLLNQMDVSGAKDRLPAQVSGGEAQRASVARAMINEPGIIFADEPTGALNRKNSEEVLNLLTDLHQKGQSILMVTHDLRAAIRGTRLLYMADGKITGELTLDPFATGDIKDRETRVNAWLTALAW